MIRIPVTPGRALLGGLFLSLALNLFLVGLVAGRWAGGSPNEGPLRPAPNDGLGPVGPFRQAVQQLPESERKLFVDALRRHRPELQPLRQAYAAAQQSLRAAIAGEPFDAAAVAAAFAEVRRTGDAVQAAVHTAVTEALGDLPPLSRHFLADFRNRPNRPEGRQP